MLYRDIIKLEIDPKKFHDLTDKINEIVEKSSIREGLCHVFVQSTTSGLWINENDRLLVEDIKRLLEAIAPENRLYQHPENAHSHLHASMLRAEHTIPVSEGRLALGTWQSVILWNFDTRKRTRTVIVTVGN